MGMTFTATRFAGRFRPGEEDRAESTVSNFGNGLVSAEFRRRNHCAGDRRPLTETLGEEFAGFDA